ncbi:hypothetical protein N8192_00280 [bacterium]|nr:hypothetical protein [bacterium]
MKKAILLILTVLLWVAPGQSQVSAKYDRSLHLFTHKDKSFAKIEVGDKTAKTFQPHVRLDRWDGECQFSVRLRHNESSPTVTAEGDKIKWQGREVKALFYDTKDAYEFEVVLNKKPDSNKVVFDIQTKGLEFLYQPPLTAEEATHATRPNNVVGSYAVYHKTMAGDYTKMGGKDYKAGKAFHIYRPRIEDSAGQWVWGNLNIDEKAGLLTVTIPQDFLDKAVYPVHHAAGLTFGLTAAGGSMDSASSGGFQIHKVYGTPASSGTITSVSLYAAWWNAQWNFDPAVYGDFVGTWPVGTFARIAHVDSGGTQVGGAAYDQVIVTTSISAPIVAGTQYWLGRGADGGGTFRWWYDTQTNESVDVIGAGWPNPNTMVHDWNWYAERVTIWATYTATPTGITAVMGVTTPSAVYGVTSPSAVYGVTP